MSRAFVERHIGPRAEEREAMLAELGCGSLEELREEAVPRRIGLERELKLPPARSESEALADLKELLGANVLLKSLIGQGYYGTKVPPVIQRNILENPGWYTAYTPYQAEISQGRLEALMNFQTMVSDLTGMDLANSSLLDEGTAAAEAMSLCLTAKPKGRVFWVDESVHPQTLAVLQTRAEPLGIELVRGSCEEFAAGEGFFGALLQYPASLGEVRDFTAFAEEVHAAGGLLVVATDLLALCLLKEPGAMAADVCVGSSQRFGVPLGFGGPHAAFIACRDKLTRKLPGRIIGLSVDSHGKPAYRLALQTREQHIRRDKATSNICTAQVLLAVMASMYAVWHGPEGLRAIAQEVHDKTRRLAQALRAGGWKLRTEHFFDTLEIETAGPAAELIEKAEAAGFHLRSVDQSRVALSLDETVTEEELAKLAGVFGVELGATEAALGVEGLRRESEILTQKIFNLHHSETEMMRYLRRLEGRDLALNEAMIPLGSCTMKLNAAAEMMPVSWPELANLHPFVPEKCSVGTRAMLDELADWLAEITGFAAVSLQPNAGSQGEYAGLLAIRNYHASRGEEQRDVCLIPMSAHGTNPASAVMAGMKVVVVKCDAEGNIDVEDLRAKVEKHRAQLAALMVTYPSTHGVFEEGIIEICELIHEAGGQVYMDGANMNAQVGLTSPGRIGADVCHLNLHKTFCIPHGGGGPGVGPVGVAAHLVPFLPGDGLKPEAGRPVISAAPYGSASVNVISWMYIAMMGAAGLREATLVSLLSVNYLAQRLGSDFPVLFTGRNGRVAHECIIDLRPLGAESGVTVEDVAKRLIDYGFHSPTMSWPVPGTLMIEPTESEPKAELDRFVEAMAGIRREIDHIIGGKWSREDHPLKNAPHTAESLLTGDWAHAYSREEAAYPVASLRRHKFWSYVGRVDNVHGDRNLVCTCDPVAQYADDE
ncbi:MAG: aminomethyl-transferring glycine dehydrogenase [Verrucomicrobiales bacterium]